jgi:hypothetical protein
MTATAYKPCLTCEGHGIEYTGYKIICRECDGAGWKWYPVSGQSTLPEAPKPILPLPLKGAAGVR